MYMIMNWCSQCHAWQFLNEVPESFPPTLHRGRRMHHLPMSLAYLPSLSWQPLKQINFTLMLQLKSSSCPPWWPNSSQERHITANLPFFVEAWRNPKAACDCFLMCHKKHQAKEISLPHISPTGAGEEGCRDKTANQQPVAHPGSLRAPAQAGASVALSPPRTHFARSIRRDTQMLVRPSLPMLGSP